MITETSYQVLGESPALIHAVLTGVPGTGGAPRIRWSPNYEWDQGQRPSGAPETPEWERWAEGEEALPGRHCVLLEWKESGSPQRRETLD